MKRFRVKCVSGETYLVGRYVWQWDSKLHSCTLTRDVEKADTFTQVQAERVAAKMTEYGKSWRGFGKQPASWKPSKWEVAQDAS